jgi:hypothetical protein
MAHSEEQKLDAVQRLRLEQVVTILILILTAGGAFLVRHGLFLPVGAGGP